MLYIEFVSRTGYYPKAEEYAEIEAEYLRFDGDKDEFCRAWMRAHPVEMAEAAREKAVRDTKRQLNKIFWRLDDMTSDSQAAKLTASCTLDASERKALERAGFNLSRYRKDIHYTLYEFKRDIRRFALSLK